MSDSRITTALDRNEWEVSLSDFIAERIAPVMGIRRDPEWSDYDPEDIDSDQDQLHEVATEALLALVDAGFITPPTPAQGADNS